MDSFTRPDRDLNKELSDFIDYVFSFYGDVDPVYPMRKVIGDTPLNKSDILDATYDYLSTISKRNSETYTWGEGDSLRGGHEIRFGPRGRNWNPQDEI